MLDGADVIAFANGLAGLDLDATRLHRFRELALQFNLEQALVHGSAFYQHVVGEIKPALERPARDAAIQVLSLILFALIRRARDRQRVLLDGHVDLFGFEAGNRKGDAISVFAGAQDIAGRIMILRFEAQALVHEVEKAVEADRRPPEGVYIQCPHSHILR